MKAVHLTRFGDPSVLGVVDLPDPEPRPGQISIDVTHAAVGLIDVFFRQGLFKDQEGLPQPPFVPGLEVAGTVRALGDGVTGFTVGEKVVTLSATGTGGYASVLVSDQALVISTEGYGIDPALAVAAVPNAAMASSHSPASPACPRVRASSSTAPWAVSRPLFPASHDSSALHGWSVPSAPAKLEAASATRLPYDEIVDSAELPDALHGQTFDVVIDPVGVRSAPGASICWHRPAVSCWSATRLATGAVSSTATGSGSAV